MSHKIRLTHAKIKELTGVNTALCIGLILSVSMIGTKIMGDYSSIEDEVVTMTEMEDHIIPLFSHSKHGVTIRFEKNWVES
jgi:hypothetical protein